MPGESLCALGGVTKSPQSACVSRKADRTVGMTARRSGMILPPGIAIRAFVRPSAMACSCAADGGSLSGPDSGFGSHW